jgi:hypothetical protein
MRIISRDANLDDIRAALREWIAILAQERFDEAAYWLATEDAEFFEPSDEFDAAPRTWSGNKLQAIIANFGIGGDLRGDVIDGRIHVPAPVSPAIVKDFEQHLRVHFFYGPDDEFNDPEDADLDPRVGGVHVNIPLKSIKGISYVSDLTAQIELFKHGQQDMIFGLRNIHVM